MPSNRELSEQAAALAVELGVEAKTQGLNNAGLTALVAELNAQLTAKSSPAPDAPAAPAPAAAEAPAPAPEQQQQQTPPVNGADDGTRGGPPRAAAAQPAAPPSTPSPRPASWPKRPTIAEYVAAGYKAETYDEHMASWERDLVARSPEPAPIDGTSDGARGGKPSPQNQARRPYPYTVAEGKVVTTLRGPLGAFQRVKASDFRHGQKALDELVAAGAVVKSS